MKKLVGETKSLLIDGANFLTCTIPALVQRSAEIERALILGGRRQVYLEEMGCKLSLDVGFPWGKF